MAEKQFAHTIIIRYAGELAIKGDGHFQRFVSRLMDRIRYNLKARGIPFELRQSFSHLLLSVDQKQVALGILSKTFGISSYSPAELSVESDLDAMVEAASQMISLVKGKRFAVRAKRIGECRFKTPDVERAVGAVLSPHGVVDLGSPEVVVYVEIVNQRAYLFGEKIPGAGGLPLNRRERCLVLLSGGFDSAVAAWQMLKRGVACDYLFCNMGGKFHQRQALQVAKVLNDLWAGGSRSSFLTVDFNPGIAALREHISNSYRQVLLKRLMCRVAERVAIPLGSKALVMGDSLGQVTSQSLQNIRVIDNATSFPVFRPLIGWDKEEIIARAYQVGTGLLSEKVTELCGISKGQPVTNAKYGRVLELERALPLELADDIFRSLEKTGLDGVDGKSLRRPYIFAEELDPKAQIIDCQEGKRGARSWAVPNSRHIPFDELCKSYRSLDKGKKYILYCTFGSKSLHMAEIMQQSGYEAYAFPGGIKKVKQAVAWASN